MAFLDELKAIFEAIIDSIREFFSPSDSKFRYTRELLLMIGAAIVFGAGFLGYRWYVVSREQKAQQIFSEYMQDYFYAMKENNPQEWERIESLFSFGHTTYGSSYLAPYFLSLQADAQLKQNKPAEALQTLHSAIASLPQSSVLLPLLQTKAALIQLDSFDEKIKEEGVQSLISLARNAENKNNDIALFYLGKYYWEVGKTNDARNAWQELVDNNLFEKSTPSPWAHEAKLKLQQFAN